MATFALVSEGITDQAVLETIIRAHCRCFAVDEVDVVPLQPMRDATDDARAGTYGGWEQIFEFCSASDRIVEALSFNDYLVIHLDTDCAEHPNFGIKIIENGVERSVAELVRDASDLLIAKMTKAIYELYGSKIVLQ